MEEAELGSEGYIFWGVHFALEDPEEIPDPVISFPAGSVVKRTGWQRCPWWVGKCMGLWQLDERVYQHVILSFPSHSLPVHSIKLSSQPPIQAGDDEKNQRTITVNPAHMGKAFKVMNELRRYFSYFARALLEGTCWVSVIRDWEQRPEHHQLVKSDSSSPTLLTWLSLSNSDRDRMASSNFSFLCIYLTPIVSVLNHWGKKSIMVTAVLFTNLISNWTSCMKASNRMIATPTHNCRLKIVDARLSLGLPLSCFGLNFCLCQDNHVNGRIPSF